ncbi:MULTISPECIES: hypothetical protein [unclassified Mesorhizobium]|nr:MULTISPECIES: hypothetical protein [unclassified Mesorhizobium]
MAWFARRDEWAGPEPGYIAAMGDRVVHLGRGLDYLALETPLA